MTTTLNTFILDRSGSMGMILEGTIEAFNAYVDGLKDAEGMLFNLVQFDTEGIDRVHHEVPIKDVPHLTKETFVPRGGTPLIDAAYSTIKAVEAAVDRRKEAGEEVKVIVCIQTDGHENSSREHSWAELKELIEGKTAQGWQFNFMGAGIDAYQQANLMGVKLGSTVSYSNDRAATRAIYASAALNAVNYASGMVGSTEFLSSQKLAAGDAYDPDLTSSQVKTVAPRVKREDKKGVTL